MIGGGGTWVGISSLGDKVVRSTRFVIVNSGTSGTVTLPLASSVVLDDFGGTTDASVSKVSAGKPTFEPVVTALGAVVTTTFDAQGNYSFSQAPASYPVALVYRVQQRLEDFDSLSSDIIGSQSNTVTWGQIAGTVSDQTDLYQAFVSLGGKLVLNSRTVTANAIISSSDYYIGCSSSSSISVTLPSLASCEVGQVFVIKDELGESGAVITVSGSDGALIDGSLNFQLRNRESIECVSRGSYWAIK